MRCSTLKPLPILIWGAGCYFAVSTVLAQSSQLEEVVVTAQKRAESLQDTPISIRSFSQDQLVEKGVHQIEDLQAQVPNLQFSGHPNSATTPRIYIRGVGLTDDQITQDPSVAVYLDGVYLARSQGLSMDVADIERIEVLRGPQGMLYGRNATGGSINFVNRAPNPEAMEFDQQLTVGERNLLRSKSVLNMPVGERAAVKLSYLNISQDGFVRNAGTGSKRFGDTDRQAVMLSGLWQPTDSLELRYTYDQSEIEDSPAYLAPVPAGFGTAKRPTRSATAVANLEDNAVDSRGHMATLTWAIDDRTEFKSITAYRKLESDTYQDYLTGVFAPLPVFTTDYNATQDQWSQEFQLQGSGASLDYIVGLYYFEEEAASLDMIDQPLSGSTSTRLTEIENSAYAIYGQASWRPAAFDQRFTITAGLRYSADQRKARLAQSVGPINTNVPAGPFVGNGDNDFENVSPGLVLAYDLTDDVNIYAKYVEGYKTGGYAIRASSIEMFNAGFDEETLASWELGIKSELLQRRLRINAALFTMNYDDIQVSISSDPTNASIADMLNAGKATIKGMELDVTALLANNLTLGFSYGYVNPGYDKVISPTGLDETHLFRFIHVPKHNASATLSYDFPRTRLGYIRASVDYAWQDDKYSGTAKEVSPVRNGIDGYGLLNARLTLKDIPLTTGELELALWGKNLADEAYYTSHLYAGVSAAAFGNPRTVGAELVYRYRP